MRSQYSLFKTPAVPAAMLLCATLGSAQGTNGTTERVSLNVFGFEAVQASVDPSISGDGNIVAFVSYAALLPTDVNAVPDVYALDRSTGDLTCVSTDGGGDYGNGPSHDPDVSSDGRYVAFISQSTNLVPLDFNGTFDVFVKDLQTGLVQRISEAPGLNAAAPGTSLEPSISTDGRYVAFQSTAETLVPGDTNGQQDIFVADRVHDTMTLVSTGVFAEANGGSGRPSISDDGSTVAFSSSASNLVIFDLNGMNDVFVRDVFAGTTTILTKPGGVQADGFSFEPEISGNGQFVTFTSHATNLVAGDTNAVGDIFCAEVATGDLTLLSRQGAEADDHSGEPAISYSGRYVAYSSLATNLIAGDVNNARDIFLHDRLTGRTVLASRATGFTSFSDGDSQWPALSSGGDVLAFFSAGTNLIGADGNGLEDVFVRTLYADPVKHCQSTTTSAGCEPSIDSFGLPQASNSSGFKISAGKVPNQKNGLLFYGLNGSAELPMLGGTLCVQPPIGRTPIQFSGAGGAALTPCEGSYAIDMNAFAAGLLGGTPQPALSLVGQEVNVQWWGRDPASPAGTFLSDGLTYVVGP